MNNFLKHNLEMPLTGGISSGGSGGSTDIIDTYKQGDIFTTTRKLSDNDYLEVFENTSVNDFENQELFNNLTSMGFKENRQNKISNIFNISNSEYIYIPWDDQTIFSFNEFSNERRIYTFKKDGEIDSIETQNDGPDVDLIFLDFEAETYISYDVYFSKSLNKKFLYFKYGSSLYVFVKDFSTNSEYSFDVQDYFSSVSSVIKCTEKYVYELKSDSVVRYNYPTSNIQLPASGSTVVTKADFANAGFNGTFSGVTTSSYYNFGQDINILTFEDQNKLEEIVFADKRTTNSATHFFRCEMPETLSPSTFLSNSIEISVNGEGFSANGSATSASYILNSNLTNIILDKNLILQDEENSVIIGTLVQYSVNGDTLKNNGEDVFNRYYIQNINLIDNSLYAFNRSQSVSFTRNSKLNGLEKDNKMAFDLISHNSKSLTFVVFMADDNNIVGGGQLNFLNSSILANLNIKEGYVDSGNGFYYKIYEDETFVYDLMDKNEQIMEINKNSMLSDMYFNLKYDNINSCLNTKAEKRGYEDKHYMSCIIFGDRETFGSLYVNEGIHFSKISNQKNVRTYIKK